MHPGRILSRRRAVAALSLGAAGVLLPRLAADAAEGQLETASVRLVQDPSACVAPEYVVEDLLRDEGFVDIGYVPVASDADDQKMLNENKADFALDFALKFIAAIDAGDPLTVLCGVHLGCFELFAKESIRNRFVENFTSSAQIASYIMDLEYFGFPLDYLDTYTQHIAEVSAEDLHRMGHTYLHPEHSTILVEGDLSTFDKPLATLGKPQEIKLEDYANEP